MKDDMSNSGFVYGSLIYQHNKHPRIQHLDTLAFTSCLKGTEGKFTGLVDMNGVDIYEGDIISARRIGANYPTKWVVVFNDDEAFRMRWEGRYLRKESSFYDEKVDVLKHNIFEVIGNIHEHPNLLKS